MNFVWVEEQFGIQIRTGLNQAYQARDTPEDNHKQRRGPFKLFDGTELQRLDAAGVFQNVEQHSDLPARAAPVNQLNDCLGRAGRAVGQQALLDWLDAAWRVDIASDYAVGEDAFARRQRHPARLQLLAHRACLHAKPRRHRERELADRHASAVCLRTLACMTYTRTEIGARRLISTFRVL